jgi:hypothetical protein
MVKSVEGIYRNGRVQVVEPLAARGLAPLAEDGDRHEMAATLNPGALMLS